MRRTLPFAAVWLLGVAGLWWLLPPAPRHVWQLPPTARHVLVTADGVVIVTGEIAGLGSTPTPFHGPLEAWDIATGRRVWTDFAPDDCVTVGLADGGTDVWSYRAPDPTVIVRVAATGERVAWDVPRINGRRVRFQGHSTAIVDAEQTHHLDLFALADGRRLGTLPVAGQVDTEALGQFGWRDGFIVSADGRRALMAVRGPDELHLYDLETAVLLASLLRDWADVPDALLAGGEAVLIGHSIRLVRTGQTVLTLPDTLDDTVLLPADDRWLVVWHDGADGCWLSWFDVITGQEAVSRRFVPSREPSAYVHAECPSGKTSLFDPCPQDGRWLWCKVEDSRTAGPVNRFLSRLPGLAHLAGEVDVSRCWLLDASTGRVAAELAGRGLQFLRATDDRLYVQTDGRVEVWDIPPRPSWRLFAALAAGWGLLVFAAARWRRRRAVVSSVTPS